MSKREICITDITRISGIIGLYL